MPGCRSTKGLCQTLEIPGADKQKGLLSRWLVTLQKTILFLQWTGVFFDRDLLMGALTESLKVPEKFKISERKVQFIAMMGL